MKATRSPPLPAYRLAPGTGPRWLEPFLARMVERLRAGRVGDALLIEQWWDGHSGEVRLLPFSIDLALAMETLGESIPIRWSPRLRDHSSEPPPGLEEEWFRVVGSSLRDSRPETPRVVPPTRVPVDRKESSPGATASPEAAMLPANLLPVGTPFWVALQTHWTTGPDGEVWATVRGRLAAGNTPQLRALGSAVAVQFRRFRSGTSDAPLELRRIRFPRRWRHVWVSGARPWWDATRSIALGPDLVAASVPFPMGPDPDDDPRLRHAVVLGASGSGKTAALAQLARQALGEGRSVVLFDVHGDLAPRVSSGLPPALRERLVGIDVTGTPRALPGLSVFGPVPREDQEALVAHLVAALKRLSTENGETFWGFRLERLFETFLHIVQAQGGDLVDLWSLLTDPRRRDAARLTTDRPEIARFLEDLDGIVRRQPEFLWPAASRVAKVVASPLLAALLAPQERSLEVGERLLHGDSTIWRLPIGELGPEGVTFAVTLLLTRVYLEEVRRASHAGPAPELRVLFVLDEAHLFPARLLSEIVAEGRKFGLGLVLATQYPTRLALELREALTGAAGTVYLFRVPWASAVATGSWAGLGPDTAQRTLPFLPPGWAVVSSTGPNADRRLVAMPPSPPADLHAWQSIVQRSADLYGSPVQYGAGGETGSADQLEETLLLGLVGLDAEGGAATRSRLLRWADFDDRLDPVLAVQALEGLHRRGWVSRSGEALFLSPAGADRIGLSARTGARPESVEHRALLVAALRIFAHHHERLEILRQGRFDTRLPDGRVPLLPPPHRRGSPAELADSLDRRRADWLWRCFGGRDVHVEAEVSGATRRERIERDWTKARDAGAFLLVLVGDAGRARSVRRYLQRLDVPRTRAAVWTLPSARNVLPTRD
ncbi:MAG: helicase HerA-like domain-containing protein [Thermoplasmata archaeon]